MMTGPDIDLRYPGGFEAHSIAGDPKVRKLQDDWNIANDYRLEPDSPAIGAGVKVPEELPDPLREQDADQPDIGALPHGATCIWG